MEVLQTRTIPISEARAGAPEHICSKTYKKTLQFLTACEEMFCLFLVQSVVGLEKHRPVALKQRVGPVVYMVFVGPVHSKPVGRGEVCERVLHVVR